MTITNEGVPQREIRIVAILSGGALMLLSNGTVVHPKGPPMDDDHGPPPPPPPPPEQWGLMMKLGTALTAVSQLPQTKARREFQADLAREIDRIMKESPRDTR